jgi:hypothetical protein
MKFVFTSQASHVLSNGKLIHTEQLDEMVIPKVGDKIPKVICKHQLYCIAKNMGNTNCLTDQQRCETYKFYNKYGENWNSLGVGA